MKTKKRLFSSIVGIPVVFALTTVAIAAIIFLQVNLRNRRILRAIFLESTFLQE